MRKTSTTSILGWSGTLFLISGILLVPTISIDQRLVFAGLVLLMFGMMHYMAED